MGWSTSWFLATSKAIAIGGATAVLRSEIFETWENPLEILDK